MARYNDLDAGRQATVDTRGPLAIDLTIGRALIERRCRATDQTRNSRTVQTRRRAARTAYQANSRAAFMSAITPSRGTEATLYA